MLQTNLYMHKLKHVHAHTYWFYLPLSKDSTSVVPTHRHHFIASHLCYFPNLNQTAQPAVELQLRCLCACMHVFAGYRASWSGYLADIQEEQQNKTEEEIRRERSDKEAMEIKMTEMVWARAAERRQRGLAAERGRHSFFFLFPLLCTFSCPPCTL